MTKFPVYNICNISASPTPPDENILVEDFAQYIDRHYAKLNYPHRHAFYHIVLFTAGQGTHTIDFKTFPVEAGQAYFMIPGQVHGWQFEGRVEGYIVNFSETYFKSFLLNSSYLDQFSFFSGNCDEGVIRLNGPAFNESEQLMHEMLKAAGSTQAHEDLIRVILLRFLMLADEASGKKTANTVPNQKVLTLKTFRNLIEKNYRQLKLPNEYAALMYITPHHLNALCQDLTGQTAGELIRDRVVLEAKRLLVNDEMTAAEIAWNLNFKDASYFNRFFKKATGLTPFEFRKQIK
jgi:AraC-like DNA-binding protein